MTNRGSQASLPHILITDGGNRLKIDSFIDSGGQGEVFRAFLEKRRQPVALKLFNKYQATPMGKRRIKMLAASRLDRLDSGICAPFDTITSGGLTGHVAPFAEGSSLLEYLEVGSLTYSEIFEVALRIVGLVQKIESEGIIHGDLQTQNFKMNRTNQGYQVYMIDLDNYSAQSVPKPNMLGMTLYIAPELRNQINCKTRPFPTVHSDRYSLGVLLHEILLHFHPIAGFDATMDDINSSMTSNWKYDPELPAPPTNPHGYPVSTLSPALISLLRLSLSSETHSRPSSDEWQGALRQAVKNLSTCKTCNVPYVDYSGRRRCPFEHQIRCHVLRLDNHQEIRLSGLTTVLGRSELGGSKNISRKHLIIREIGSNLYVESIGMNPTFRLKNGDWCPMTKEKLTLLKPNDRLMVANTKLIYTA